MTTLLLRLAGPMQAWGTDSKVDTRTTGAQPSKSGIVGMIAAAMGRSRDELVDDISALRFGVRTDQGGTILRDYHTAHHPTEKREHISRTGTILRMQYSSSAWKGMYLCSVRLMKQ